jgi:hypothetical protein
MRRLAARGLGLAVLLGAGLLRAEPAPPTTARLEYSRGRGAEACPDEDAVQRAVTARLGYDPFRPDAPRIVTATVRRDREALRGDVDLRDRGGAVKGARHLTAAENDCAELVAAMALAISIAIDPQSLLRSSPPASPDPPAPPLPPEPPPDPASPAPATRPGVPAIETPPVVASPPVASPPTSRPPPLSPPPRASLPIEEPRAPAPSALSWRLGLGGLLAAGAAPALSVGGALEVGVRWRALSIAVEGRADAPAGSSAEGGGAVRASLLEVSLVPCFHAGLVVACGLGSLGSLRGVGSGVPLPRDAATLFGAAGLRLGVELPISRALSLAFHGDLAATLTRTTLMLADRPVWTTPLVSGVVGAGVLAHFP